MNVKLSGKTIEYDFAVEGVIAREAFVTGGGREQRREVTDVKVTIYSDGAHEYQYRGWLLRKDGRRSAQGSHMWFSPDENDVWELSCEIEARLEAYAAEMAR